MNLREIGKGLVVFLLWMSFTCSCHWFTKRFLSEMQTVENSGMVDGVSLSLLVTISQLLACWLLLDFNISTDGNQAYYRNILMFTHFTATLTTNVSFSLMRASSTVTIKLLEPILSACLTHYITRTTNITATTYISLILLCAGAVSFVGNPLSSMSIGIGTGLAIISNVFYGIRNVVKKHGIDNMEIHGFDYLHYFIITGILAGSVYFNQSYTLPLMLLFGSSASHVIYSYVSMFIVLKYLGVVTHAIANIFKRVTVIVCLMILAKEGIDLWQFAGLAICIVGLALYSKQKLSGGDKAQNNGISDDQGMKVKVKYTTVFMTIVLAVALSFMLYGNHSHKPTQQTSVEKSSPPEHAKFVGDLVKQAKDLKDPNYHPSGEFVMEDPNLYIERLEWKEQTDKVIRQAVGESNKVVLMNTHSVDTLGEAMFTYGLILTLQRLKMEIVDICAATQCEKIIAKTYGPDVAIISRMSFGSKIPHDMYTKLVHAFPNNRVSFILRYMSDYNHESFSEFSKAIKATPNIHLLTCESMIEHQLKNDVNPALNVAQLNDLAFSLDNHVRFMDPIYDIVWLSANASGIAKIPGLFPENIRWDSRDWMTQKDWRHYVSPDPLENSYIKTYMGLFFVQRGRVFITERMDGLIAAIVSDIPVVAILNIDHNMDQFLKSWSKQLGDRVKSAESREKSVNLAISLLSNPTVPPIAPFMKSIVHTLKHQKGQEAALG